MTGLPKRTAKRQSLPPHTTSFETPKSYRASQSRDLMADSQRRASATRMLSSFGTTASAGVPPCRRGGIVLPRHIERSDLAAQKFPPPRSAPRPVACPSRTSRRKRRSARSCPAACAPPAGHGRGCGCRRRAPAAPMRAPTRTGCGKRRFMRSFSAISCAAMALSAAPCRSAVSSACATANVSIENAECAPSAEAGETARADNRQA